MKKLADISQFESLMNRQPTCSGNSVFNAVNKYIPRLPAEERKIAEALYADEVPAVYDWDTYDDWRNNFLNSNEYRLLKYLSMLPDDIKAAYDDVFDVRDGIDGYGHFAPSKDEFFEEWQERLLNHQEIQESLGKLLFTPEENQFIEDMDIDGIIEPGDTFNKWYKRTMKHPYSAWTGLSAEEQEIAKGIARDKLPAYASGDSSETWRNKLLGSAGYKSITFPKMLSDEERDIVRRLGTDDYSPTDEDSYESWYDRLVHSADYKKQMFLDKLSPEEYDSWSWLLDREDQGLLIPRQRETFEAWHDRFLNHPKIKIKGYREQLTPDELDFYIGYGQPEDIQPTKEDTYDTWYDRLRKHYSEAGYDWGDRLPKKEKDIYEQLSQYDKPRPQADEDFTSWRKRLKDTRDYKKILFEGLLTPEEQDIYSSYFPYSKYVEDEDTFESWHQRVVEDQHFKQGEYVNQLNPLEQEVARDIKSDLPEVEDKDTFNSWRRKLVNSDPYKNALFKSKLPDDEKNAFDRISSRINYNPVYQKDTFASWHKRLLDDPRFKRAKMFLDALKKSTVDQKNKG